MLNRLSVLLACYLVSAVPFGYLLYKHTLGGDIRRQGSGNIGATNVLRSGGRAAGTATLLLDACKGALAVWLARWLIGEPRWVAAAAFVAVVAHCFPVYLGFKGGKGIATGCGAYGLLAPVPMALTLAVFLAVVLLSRMASVGSMCAALALVPLIWWWQPEAALMISAAAAVLLSLVRHRENIRRIFGGGEHRIAAERDAAP